MLKWPSILKADVVLFICSIVIVDTLYVYITVLIVLVEY